MTEQEKCAAGLLYDANYNEEILKLRDACKDVCFAYNNTIPSQLAEKKELLRKLFGKVHGDFYIQSPFWCDYGCNIELGRNFYANHNLIILDGAKVTFGDNVFIAPDCGFHTAGHPIDFKRRNQGLEYAYPITVGDNVWFGAGVHVMPGVTIGSNVVIGAGSIVTKDIPDNVVAVGNPCRVLRPITDEDFKKEYTGFAKLMNFTVRAYIPSDLPRMIAIWNEVVEEGTAFPQTEPLNETTGPAFFAAQTCCGVAEGCADGSDTKEVLGLYILHPNNEGRCGHICNASYAVSTKARGLHIGEQLVLDCMAQGRAHGFRILQFNAVVRTNTHARHLYERLGFEQLGVIPGGFLMKDGHYEDICPYYHLL